MIDPEWPPLSSKIDNKDANQGAQGVFNAPVNINISTDSSAACGSAPPRPPDHVGREKDLCQLKLRLGIPSNDQGITSIHTLAVWGWPGVGKTTLVSKLAYDYDVGVAFRHGVLWVSLGPEPDILPGLGAWITTLGDNPNPYSTPENRRERLSGLLRDRQMLLIIDDVWEAAHATLFPLGGERCRVLITTRFPAVAHDLALPDKAIYHLGVLQEPDSLDLLTQLIPEAVKSNLLDIQLLVKELEGLPLALQIAGRLISNEAAMGWGINDLLKELREGERLLQEKAPANYVNMAYQTKPTVDVLLQKNIDRLDETTRDRFALLGTFVEKPATFDENAVAALWNTSTARPTLRTLVDGGLLEPVSGGRFQMHSLLAVLARSLLRRKGN